MLVYCDAYEAEFASSFPSLKESLFYMFGTPEWAPFASRKSLCRPRR